MKIIQNSCQKCEFYDTRLKKCSIKEGSDLRKCVIGINKKLLMELNSKSKKKKISILEIGCGIWSPIKDGVHKNIEWKGIDVVSEIDNKPTIATDIASVEKMPYQNDYFDYAFANQSAEHWFEYGVTFERALHEISRVLKKDGLLYLNVPIHLHGDKMFMLGQIDKVMSQFNSKYWDLIQVEYWRKEFAPLNPVKPWEKDDFLKHMLRKKIPKTAWILNIKIRKKNDFPESLKAKMKRYALKAEMKIMPRKARMAKHYGVFNTVYVLGSRIKRKMVK